MISESCYRDCLNFVEQRLNGLGAAASDLPEKHPFRDRFEHTKRVMAWARRLAPLEGGDIDVVSMAAIFHDVSKGSVMASEHARHGAEVCTNYLLDKDLPPERARRVAAAVRNHSSKDACLDSLTIEDRILIDADSLDEVGALTVLWDAMAVAGGESPGYRAAYARLQGSLIWLKQSAGHLITHSGRRLYMERMRVLQSFCYELAFEIGESTREAR